jgi:hypothetical protein
MALDVSPIDIHVTFMRCRLANAARLINFNAIKCADLAQARDVASISLSSRAVYPSLSVA